MNPKVDKYIQSTNKWQDELTKLREIILGCQLEESLKWGSPCYTFNGSNILGIRGFKEHCAAWFFKGALLRDPYKILLSSSEDTLSLRQIRFTSMDEILETEQKLREYIYEAVDVEKAGLSIPARKNAAVGVPEEFQKRLDDMPELNTAFSNLTPGRQREYCLYFSEPKQAATKEARIEKCLGQILEGKGLNDKYMGKKG